MRRINVMVCVEGIYAYSMLSPSGIMFMLIFPGILRDGEGLSVEDLVRLVDCGFRRVSWQSGKLVGVKRWSEDFSEVVGAWSECDGVNDWQIVAMGGDTSS